MLQGRTVAALGFTLGLLAAGCAAPGLSPLNYSVRAVTRPDRVEAFQIAEEIMVDSGYPIEVRDPDAGLLRSTPINVADAESASARSLRQPRLQRVAEIRVQPSAEGVRIFCRVEVLQQTTEAHRWLAFDRTASDVPGQTPIEREAATTARQNTVWETVRREKPRERAILEQIQQRAGVVEQAGRHDHDHDN